MAFLRAFGNQTAHKHKQVRPWELLPWARTGAAATRSALGMALLALRAERTAHWIASLVLWQPTPAARTSALAFALEVATECLGLNNYNSIVHIMTGLLAPAIVRLRRVWKALSDMHRNRFRSLRSLMASDDNYAAYRSFLSSQAPPCVPFVMVRHLFLVVVVVVSFLVSHFGTKKT